MKKDDQKLEKIDADKKGKHPQTGPKLNPQQKQIVIQLLGCWESVESIQEFLLTTYKITVSNQAIYGLNKSHNDEIWALRAEHAKNISKLYPIANKDYRIKEISRMYNDTIDKDLKQKLLMRAKQEVGDDVALIAEALRSKGNSETVNNYNFDFRTVPDDERNRIGRELSRAFGTRF